MPNQLAIITGASSGLGKALARRLALEGYALAIVGRDERRLTQTLPPSSDVKHFVVDLAERGPRRDLVRDCCEAFAQLPLTLLVNCAGEGISGRVEDIPFAEFERAHALNYLAAVDLTQQALPVMTQQNRGTVVNVTSGVSFRALPFIAPYASAKAALNAFTDSLRVELAATRINVMLFSPGAMATGFQTNKRHFGSSALRFPPLFSQTPEKIAGRLLRAIQRGEERVLVGGRAGIARHLQYWSPRLTDVVVRRLYRAQT